MPNCFGESTGAIALSLIGGTGPYSALWSNGDTTQNLSNAASGTYSVTVTDANGCVVIDSSSIGVPPDFALATSVVPETVLGSCDGSAAVAPSGLAVAIYTYLWDDPMAQTDSMATGLCNGTYHVIVTSYRGCIKMDTVIVGSGPVGIDEMHPEYGVKAYPNPFLNTLTFEVPKEFSSVSSIEIFDLQGKSIRFESSWIKNKIHVKISTLQAGTYVYKITCGNKEYRGKIIALKDK
jgi:hypothetical protein